MVDSFRGGRVFLDLLRPSRSLGSSRTVTYCGEDHGEDRRVTGAISPHLLPSLLELWWWPVYPPDTEHSLASVC